MSASAWRHETSIKRLVLHLWKIVVMRVVGLQFVVAHNLNTISLPRECAQSTKCAVVLFVVVYLGEIVPDADQLEYSAHKPLRDRRLIQTYLVRSFTV